MADEHDDDLELAPADAGAAFRAEMAATNFFMGYWKHVLAVMIAGLVGVFIFGQYGLYVKNNQRATAARIADVERDLPAPLVALPQLKADGRLPPAEDLEGAAAQLEAVAGASSGTAKVEALLKAAELYRMAGSTDARKAALVAASADATGVLKFAAESALAAQELDAGEGDSAVNRYKALSQAGDNFLAQEATIELGRAYQALDRQGDAEATYGTFLTRWPDAPRASEVERLRAQAGSNG